MSKYIVTAMTLVLALATFNSASADPYKVRGELSRACYDYERALREAKFEEETSKMELMERIEQLENLVVYQQALLEESQYVQDRVVEYVVTRQEEVDDRVTQLEEQAPNQRRHSPKRKRR